MANTKSAPTQPDDELNAMLDPSTALGDAAIPSKARVATCEVPAWGRFVMAWNDLGLMLLGLPGRSPGEHLGSLTGRGVSVESTPAPPENFRAALEAYCAGEPDDLMGLPVDQPGTPFQQEVWTALREIPVGEMRTYGAIAKEIGRDHAVRAVGQACGANLVALVVPCHRAIASHGKIGGFAAGVAWKQRLLEHEMRIRARRGL